MKTGIELIAEERQKQIDKHGFTGKHHAEHSEWYANYQLQHAAHALLADELYEQAEVEDYIPNGWNKKWFLDLLGRSRKERLIIAGALIAAEIDRLQQLEDLK